MPESEVLSAKLQITGTEQKLPEISEKGSRAIELLPSKSLQSLLVGDLRRDRNEGSINEIIMSHCRERPSTSNLETLSMRVYSDHHARFYKALTVSDDDNSQNEEINSS